MLQLRPKAQRLDGAVVVITGASSGVGRATAHAFARHGAKLVLAARGEQALLAVAEECRALGAEAVVQPTDVADPDAVDRLAWRALQEFSCIDVWIDDAGVVIAAPFGQETVAELRRLVDTNVLGTLLGARAALRVFHDQGSGVLINVSSLLGIVPNPLVPAYVASKFAVRGLSLALRQDTRDRGVRVSVVVPGPIDTPLFERSANHTGHELRAIPPAYAPERVAAAIVGCARRPRRQVTVGVVSRATLLLHRISPRLAELLVAQYSARLITRGPREEPGPGALFEPWSDGQVHGGWRRGALRRRLGESFGVRVGAR
jgi:NADP-dependent 3-hydroxy acid dehydrogenase YdfG